MGVQIRTPLPVYTSGTVAGNAGQAVVTGNSTSWTTTDASGNIINSVMGGDLFITATQAIPIKSVDSALQLTLECPLPATINPGTTYRIVKVSPNLTGGVTQALLQVMQQGSDIQPDASRTIDNGSGRVKIRQAATGDAQIAVGPSGSADAALAVAMDISAAGAVSFPNGASGGFVLGRNRLINGNFAINQRGYVGGVALPPAAYAHDRWADNGQGNLRYTYYIGLVDTIVTITAGVINQIIDPAKMEGGYFNLSWVGTVALVVYYQPAGSSQTIGPIPASSLPTTNIPAGAKVYVQSSGLGTLSNVQFEKLIVGQGTTSFDRRDLATELLLCQRYFEKSYNQSVVPGTASSNAGCFYVYQSPTPTGKGVIIVPVGLKVTKRAAPTVTLYSPNTGAAGQIYDSNAGTDVPGAVYNAGDSGFQASAQTATSQSSINIYFQYTASAEL